MNTTIQVQDIQKVTCRIDRFTIGSRAFSTVTFDFVGEKNNTVSIAGFSYDFNDVVFEGMVILK